MKFLFKTFLLAAVVLTGYHFALQHNPSLQADIASIAKNQALPIAQKLLAQAKTLLGDLNGKGVVARIIDTVTGFFSRSH